MQICDYSSLIFSGNTTVLLILALTTDYWEYRAFNVSRVISNVTAARGDIATRVIVPYETNSYIQIKVNGNDSRLPSREALETHFNDVSIHQEMYYHAPVFFIKRSVHVPRENITNNMTSNMTSNDRKLIIHEHEINLFKQYGNLFRDCDDLESSVRDALGLHVVRPKKCNYHQADKSSITVYQRSPALAHLESMAGACALLCIVTTCVGLIAGSVGLFTRYKEDRSFYVASCSTLTAGFFLTIAIALFHGKCHILQQMELFPGHYIPYKELLESSKTYSYGWSFVLAWLCVFFCYISSFVWLTKAQGPAVLQDNSLRDTALSVFSKECIANYSNDNGGRKRIATI